MLFNSIDFAIFLPIVFILYWFVTNNRLGLQNLLIVVASYIFYGWWDWRFLTLVALSSAIDYFAAIGIDRSSDAFKRKLMLGISITANLGLLAFFKYYNFFLDNFVDAFKFFGQDISVRSLEIVLPVGISFYTFQTMSYTIDVYRKNMPASKDFVCFAAFVSFFPQLVAGPIERATNLLPQFYIKREFDYSNAVLGMRQILWGLFKKIVIADNCAVYANQIFDNSPDCSGSTLVLGAIFFTFQIYGDFSGYSDIAIGTSRLFGFNLMQNFAFPYFSRDIAEFWRRWHISLSTWFRDYVYIPLGGSQGSTFKKVRNVFIVFLASGFWHGANWTFIAWGALNAIYFLPLLLLKTNRKNIDSAAEGKFLPSLREALGILTTFGLTVLAWIFFRAENMTHAMDFLSGIFSSTLFSFPYFPEISKAYITLGLIVVFVLIEWAGRSRQFAIEQMTGTWVRPLRWSFYTSLILIIFYLGSFEEISFIYFQF